MKRSEFDETLRRVLWACPTYGQLERAAGVTDRLAFWKGKTEDQARAELREMIAARVRSGEVVPAPGTPQFEAA